MSDIVIEVEPSLEKEEKEEECPICLEGIKGIDQKTRLACSHEYHTKCIHRWLDQNSTCPICRYEVVIEPHHSLDMIEAIEEIEETRYFFPMCCFRNCNCFFFTAFIANVVLLIIYFYTK